MSNLFETVSFLLDLQILLKTIFGGSQGVVVGTDWIMQDLDMERRAKLQKQPEEK